MRFQIFPSLVLMLGLLGTSANSAGAQDCPCCTPEHQLFDFWLGSWTVYDSLDQVVGSNEIVKAQNECLLVENWTSAQGSTGTSYNYYQKTNSTWEPGEEEVIQTWELLNENHKVVNMLFKGFYRKK
jgi:hypothetical protein